MTYWDGTRWVPETTARSRRGTWRRPLGAMLEGSLVASLVMAGTLAVAAVAPQFNGVVGIGEAHAARAWIDVEDAVFGSGTTATVSEGATSAAVKSGSPSDTWVRARCYQDGFLVYFEAVRTADGSAWLQLGPTDRWTSGAADCQADSGYYDKFLRWKQLASTEFAVAP